jgi:hypothetical protein
LAFRVPDRVPARVLLRKSGAERRLSGRPFCWRTVIAVTALRVALCLSWLAQRSGQEFPRCSITTKGLELKGKRRWRLNLRGQEFSRCSITTKGLELKRQRRRRLNWGGQEFPRCPTTKGLAINCARRWRLNAPFTCSDCWRWGHNSHVCSGRREFLRIVTAVYLAVITHGVWRGP